VKHSAVGKHHTLRHPAFPCTTCISPTRNARARVAPGAAVNKVQHLLLLLATQNDVPHLSTSPHQPGTPLTKKPTHVYKLLMPIYVVVSAEMSLESYVPSAV
jgi:hypothetical protein